MVTQFNSDDCWKNSTVSEDMTHHILNGKPLYDAKFDEVMSFHYPGLAPVRKGNRWFHIRPDGKVAYTGSFDKAWGYYDGLACVVKDGYSYHIKENGTPAYSSRFAWCGNYQEKLCAVRDNENNYFHIDIYGNPAYPSKFRYAGDYKSGLAAVQNDEGYYFHINRDGIPIYSELFLDLGVFHKGYAPAKDSKGWFHIDFHGNELYTERFVSVEPFYNGFSRVSLQNGDICLINIKGGIEKTIRKTGKNNLLAISHDIVGYWKSFMLAGAIDLGIFDILPAPIEKISESTGIEEERLLYLLNSLDERGYIEFHDNYWMLSHRFDDVKDQLPGFAKNIVKHWISQTLPAWANIDKSLIGQQSGFKIATGEDLFSWLDRRPDEMNVYQHAMFEYAKIDYSEIKNRIDFRHYRRIIDAGGGFGYLLESIINNSDKQDGYLLELGSVIDAIRMQRKLNSRIHLMKCDILNNWGIKGDAILLTKILHDWNDTSVKKILDNAYESLDDDGTLFITETVSREIKSSGSILSLHLFLVNGGKERGVDEFRELMKSSGFLIKDIIKLQSGNSIIIGKKVKNND